MEAQFLDQAVLQGLMRSFDPAFGLRGVCVDRGNVQGLQGASELGALPVPVRVIDAEDTVLIGIDGQRAALLGEVVLQGFHIRLRGLSGHEAEGHQPTGGVVNEDQ